MALSDIRQPSDLANLTYKQLDELASEIRDFIVESVAKNSGHLGSNLGAVELTLALHRVNPRETQFFGIPAIRLMCTKSSLGVAADLIHCAKQVEFRVIQVVKKACTTSLKIATHQLCSVMPMDLP